MVPVESRRKDGGRVRWCAAQGETFSRILRKGGVVIHASYGYALHAHNAFKRSYIRPPRTFHTKTKSAASQGQASR